MQEKNTQTKQQEKKKQTKKFARYSKITKRNVQSEKQEKPVKQEKPAKQTKPSGSRKQNKNTAEKNKPQKQNKPVSNTPVHIAFLGGLNEVGKNMTLYEYNGSMFLVDCGLAFPEPDLLGVDLVLPDFSYVEKNIDKIKGIVVTHGHEDHIGGLAYLLKTANIPIYSTKLTIGLIQGKLKEHNLLESAKLNVVKPGDTIKLGEFDVELIHVNHSIPDAVALAIRCGAGTIVQTGDFKIDTTPIDGEPIDLNRLAQIGTEGVLCLLSDSTNAERPGYTESEKKVGESFEHLFRRAGNRRIIELLCYCNNIFKASA